MNAATATARAVLSALIEAGVSEVVLAPGSRNAPLSLAAVDAAEAGVLRVHTRLDERSAAFLALGLSKVGRRTAVVCTSGTAVANLHPAVMEAAHAAVDLVVVTADRPERLRGTGASQTTDQWGVFAPHAPTLVVGSPAALEGAATETLARPWGSGPLHLNVPLDLPLLPESRWVPEVSPRARLAPALVPPAEAEIDLGPRTVVVAGDDSGPPARILAEAAGWPLLAEPSSGSRTGDAAIRTYRLLLGTDLGGRSERVVVHGHPTLSRPVLALLARDDVEVVSVRAEGFWADRPFPVDRELPPRSRLRPSASGAPVDTEWRDAWRAADRELSRRLDALLAAEADLTPYEIAGAVSRALPPGGLLFVGASNPIRDLDLMVAPYAVGDRRKIVANRGLAGIDGTVSSASGAALGRDSTRSLALMGDVTFLHDMGGLVLGPGEARPDLTIVVVNDDGGSIFATLEQGGEDYAYAYERAFGTPHGVDLASLCAATRTPHLRVDSLPALEQALAMPHGGIEVIEATCRRDNRRDLDARIRALAP